MKTVLFTSDFYPNFGGVSNVLTNIYKHFKEKEETLYVFNPFSKGKNLFDDIIGRKNFRLREFGNTLKKRKFYIYTMLSFWSVLRDKNTPFSHRIKIILYLFSRPKMFRLITTNIMNLYPILKNMNFDLVMSGNAGWILQLSYIISRMFKKKLVSMAYGSEFLIVNTHSFRTYYFRNADKIILITHKTKEIIKKMHHLDENRLEVIYVGVDTDSLKIKETKSELRKEFNISNDIFVILSVGSHVRRKNFRLVLKALSKINSSFKIKYYLIGQGAETENLKQLTKDLNLENQVTFLGHCDTNTRNKYYKMSDVFIMPSITKNNDIEGFGIVYLEANYFKVPTIGSDTGGISEAIVNGETGFLIKQNDIIDLIDKILFLYKNESQRRVMGMNGYKRVMKDFRWENIIQEYINLIKEI